MKSIAMNKLLFSFLALFMLGSFAVKAQNEVIADANAKTRTLSGSFTAISVSDGVKLYISQGTEESIAVSAADDLMDRFKTEVVDGTLKIYFDRKGWDWNKDRNRKLTAYVSFRTLKRLNGSSGSSVVVKNAINTGDLDLHFNSGAQFDGKVSAKQLSVDQNSGADVNMNGSADKLVIDISSGGSFKGYDMTVDYCEAKATSGASVKVSVNKELTGNANSGGSIHYKGAGVIADKKVSSGGSVKKA
jgi:hypothetical protein